MDDGARRSLERQGIDAKTSGLARLTIDLEACLNAHALWIDTHGERGQRADLNGVDLRGWSFAFRPLAGMRLRRSNLEGADFTGADLTMADLSFSNLEKARFADANLSGATLRGVNLSEAVLTSVNMSPVDTLGDGSKMWPTNLEAATLFDAKIARDELAKAITRSARLERQPRAKKPTPGTAPPPKLK